MFFFEKSDYNKRINWIDKERKRKSIFHDPGNQFRSRLCYTHNGIDTHKPYKLWIPITLVPYLYLYEYT